MTHTSEKKGKGQNGYAIVKKDGQEIATCYGHLENLRQGLKSVSAETDANIIADSLNLRDELKSLPSKTTKERIVSIINKYL